VSASTLGSTGRWVLRLLFAHGSVSEPEPLPKPKLRKNFIPSEVAEDVAPQRGRREEVVFKVVATPEEVVERSEPIIVKQKQTELAIAGGSLRGAKKTTAKTGKVGKGSSIDNAVSYDAYVPPDVALLTREEAHDLGEDDEELRQKAEQIESKLRDFNIAGRVTQVHPGPVITLFEFEPAAGVKVGRIAALQDDLAMSLKASSIRIIAPIPKRGTVGIEVPNKHRAMVRLRDVVESEAFTGAESILSVALGKDTYGDSVVVDIATMPHLLMAGATGTGKSVCINTLLLSLLYRANPAELGLILIDPKVLELSIYDGIPHLRVPVVTDPRQAKAVLSWAVKEMDRRYRYMQRFGVRNIDGYNQVVSGEEAQRAQERAQEKAQIVTVPPPVEPEELPEIDEDDVVQAKEPLEPIGAEVLKPLPKLVIVIDELADLMLQVGREVEELITRLAQKARAAGIHLIVATQRPSVDVITGLIKANFPARLSFRVSSRIDSRTILDSMGSEKLLGKGDMLFMLPGAVPLRRIHGAFVSDGEVQKVVASLKAQCGPQYDDNIIAACEKALTEESSKGEGGDGENEEGDEFDPFYDKALELVLEKGQASTSMIQRTFRIGYNRAARIIEQMEREGVVGKMDGVRPREILLPPGQRSIA
jgi:S-DNA-T family DNA segregation ATPase FtsK/SpoIIIE